MSAEHAELQVSTWSDPRGQHTQVTVRAGIKHVERIVPPAGEAYAFDVDVWPSTVNVYVSPKGRSVRVFVDGVEVRSAREPRRATRVRRAHVAAEQEGMANHEARRTVARETSRR